MSQVDKETNVLNDKKYAVVTTPLSEKKLLTTENVTTSYEVHKFTDKITTSEGVVKGTDEVHKHTENITTIAEFVKGTYEVHKCTQNITTNEEVDKGTEKL